MKNIDYPVIKKVPTKLEVLHNIYGIEETKDVVKFLAEAIAAGRDSLVDDGKITISDTPNLLSPLPYLLPAITGIGKVPLELKDDLTDEELEKLIDVVIEAGLATEEHAALSIARKILKIAESVKELVIYDFVKVSE